jgi:hypothetical protein
MRNRFILVVFAFLATILMTACEPESFDNFGVISGTVIDMDSGEPLDHVLITLTPTGKNSYSSMDGQFEFQDVEVGQYTVQAQKTGYSSDRKNNVNVVGGETVTVSLVMRKTE